MKKMESDPPIIMPKPAPTSVFSQLGVSRTVAPVSCAIPPRQPRQARSAADILAKGQRPRVRGNHSLDGAVDGFTVPFHMASPFRCSSSTRRPSRAGPCESTHRVGGSKRMHNDSIGRPQSGHVRAGARMPIHRSSEGSSDACIIDTLARFITGARRGEQNRMAVNVAFIDSTHTGKVVDANYSPLSVEYIAAYAKTHLGDEISTKLLSSIRSRRRSIWRQETPQIACFSNYMWKTSGSNRPLRTV